jgi:hypothetical protein
MEVSGIGNSLGTDVFFLVGSSDAVNLMRRLRDERRRSAPFILGFAGSDFGVAPDC